MSKPATATAEPAAAEAAPAGRPWLKKAMIGGIIVVIMLGEFVVICLVLPRSSQSAPAVAEEETEETAHAEEGGHAAEHGKTEGHAKAEGHGKKGEEAASGPPKSGSASEEIDLGEFSVTSYQPASNTTLFISFHLFGTLLHKNGDDLHRRLDDNKNRIRDNIIVIIRSAEITDLTDAGLGLIKRRILETTNKSLGKPLLQAVVFSDFSFVEQ